MRRSVQALLVEHAAYYLRRGLAIGDSGPACQSVVATIVQATDAAACVQPDQRAVDCARRRGGGSRPGTGQGGRGRGKAYRSAARGMVSVVAREGPTSRLWSSRSSWSGARRTKDAGERVVTEAWATVEQARLVVVISTRRAPVRSTRFCRKRSNTGREAAASGHDVMKPDVSRQLAEEKIRLYLGGIGRPREIRRRGGGSLSHGRGGAVRLAGAIRHRLHRVAGP